MTQNYDELREMFINEKPVQHLLYLQNRDGYASEVSRITDTTYSHSVKILNRFEEDGLAESERKGRRKIYSLTEKGREFVDMFSEISDHLGGLEPDAIPYRGGLQSIDLSEK